MEISQLLSEALSSDQNRRNLAEINIDNIATQDFKSFLINCSKELSDEGKHKGIRQIASTLIKNMICFQPKYKGMWEQLDKESKMQVKQHVLSTLASNDKDVRKAAGIAVAAICKIELPLGEWQDIIDILCQTSQNENKNIQLASIITLGYISTEIGLRDLSDDQCGKVLTCFYNILSNSNDLELQEVTINALLNFIPFTRIVFESGNNRNLIVGIVLKYTQNPELKIRLITIQCILEIGRLFYDYIEENMKDLLVATKFLMMNDDESSAILAYEFWCSIGDIEIARIESKTLNSKNYCNSAYRDLLEVIYQHLILLKSTEDSWNFSKASSCLLSILSQCCEYNLITEVIAYIGANIEQTSPVKKEAAIMAFGAILETVHRENMNQLVLNSIDTLINFIQDPNSPGSLKETTSWVIERISELYGAEFMNREDLFDKIINTIIILLPNSKRKIVCHLSNALHHFSINLKPADGQISNMFSKHIKTLLDLLLKLAFTPKAYDAQDNVAMSSFFAIGSLIENSAPDTKYIINSYFNDIIQAFKSTLNPEFFESEKMRHDYQAYIAACIEPILISGHIILNIDDAKQILDYIILTFKERKSVYEEGLMAASSIALVLGPQFDVLVKEFGSYLIFALNQVNETSLCKTAIHSTSDLIRAIGPAFSQYLDQIIPIILGILSNTEADKILKPHSFNVISDVFLSCKESIFNYFNNIMQLIGSALDAATYLTDDKEDFENLEYFESLREHIVECLTCIFQTVKDVKKDNEFKNYVPSIVNFLNKINGREYLPSIELTKNSLGLLADFCETYKSEMKPLINNNIVEDMIRRLNDSRSTKVKTVVQWAKKMISLAIK